VVSIGSTGVLKENFINLEKKHEERESNVQCKKTKKKGQHKMQEYTRFLQIASCSIVIISAPADL
jgi:hypothetical protein